MDGPISHELDHSASDPANDNRKTALATERARRPPLERGPDGAFVVGSYALAQQVLRSRSTEQAGFNAALVRRLPQKNRSLLFQEGEAHRRQRAATATFFTPAAVTGRYRPLMERLAGEILGSFRQQGRAVLDEMTLAMSVGVAAAIVGLTESRRAGLARRLSRILELQDAAGPGWLGGASYIVRAQLILLTIYALDVRPAIRARRRAPQSDLISKLIGQGWSQTDILIECITFGTASISTTREFMVIAALHLLERDELRRGFLAGGDDEQAAILGEILRLEPAVSTLQRRTTGPLSLNGPQGLAEIPAGSLVSVDLRSANADPVVAGACPFRLDPERKTRGPAGALSFGDGHHRCPGATVALQEAAIFLDRLLRVPGLRLDTPPRMSRNTASTGYVLRGAVLVTDG